ncbi:MAG: DUF1538 family protein [Bacilli bacterium]|nr:DUF1538 family protein [Bacilli bacterium]MDD4809460.1 DUF1538 family protein [Bacilli bacterium]
MTKAKIWFILAFCVAIGFAVTVAEPGVQVLSNQLDTISNGTFVNKYLFIITISLGVGIFLAIAAIRFVYDISLNKILIFSYALAFILVFISPKEFLAIAFDAGGVVTGPMIASVLFSIMLSMSEVIETSNPLLYGFGLLALVSLMPILSIMILSIIYKIKNKGDVNYE